MPSRSALRKVLARSAAGAGDLPSTAKKDGALISYLFNEGAGNLLDQGASHWDLASHSQVVRGAAGVCPKDKKAYTYIATGQGSPTWGHTQGNRPLLSAWNKVALECVCKIPTGTNQLVVGAAAVGILGIFALGTDVNGDVTGYLTLTGGYTASFGVTTRTTKTAFQHYIWQYDGSHFTGYVNGVQGFNITTGIGSPTFFDDTLPNARLAFGGDCDTNSRNNACTVDFFAMYPNLFLSAGQIANHFKVSGC